MGQPLDTILIEPLVESTITVNSDYESLSIDISAKEAESSIQLNWVNGINVDMDLALSVSNDNVNFIPITDSIRNLNQSEGQMLIDIFGTGVSYLRIEITVTTGSIDLERVEWHGKRRH